MIIRGRKTVLWCLIMLIALSVLTGCGQDNGGEEPPVSVEYTVDLYFFNSEYAETGDESLERYLVESREIQAAEGESPWLAVLEALKTAGDERMGTAIGEDVVFDDVSVSPEDETLMIVDFGSIGASGGSMQEGFFIGQIVQTLVGNGHLFEDGQNVDKVQFLVKGEPIDSLMGHFDASEPFTNDF